MKKLTWFMLLMAATAQAATTSPNMTLSIPQVGDTDYPTSISNSFTLIDTHDHSTGKGVVLGTNSVPTAAIQTNAVTTAKILDSNVTTAKILDSNVTTAKIADSNVTTAKILDSNVTTAKIADSNVTQAKLAARTTGTTVGVGGVAISGTTGNLNVISNGSYQVVSALDVTITTSGRPVMIQLITDGSSSATSNFTFNGSAEFYLALTKDGTIISLNLLRGHTGGGVGQASVAASAIGYLDIVSAGTYHYQVQCLMGGAQSYSVSFMKLVAYEI